MTVGCTPCDWPSSRDWETRGCSNCANGTEMPQIGEVFEEDDYETFNSGFIYCGHYDLLAEEDHYACPFYEEK